jgi:hypothetical protein
MLQTLKKSTELRLILGVSEKKAESPALLE